MDIIAEDHIKFAPDILTRLGEELIPNPDQGIIELVRNAYDADASKCTVDFSKFEDGGLTILIQDNGVGMSLDGIRKGWLVLGHSAKATRSDKRTTKGRLPVGDKGLGRLAALRMGQIAVLQTRPKTEPGVEYTIVLDWDEYANQELVENVNFKIVRGTTTRRYGTDITLKHLKVRFGRRELDRLARSLILLSDPFGDEIGFRPLLIAPGFDDLEEKVRSSYFNDAEYRLEARLDNDGWARTRLLDWRGRTTHKAVNEEISRSSEPYRTTKATFTLWVFPLSGSSFSARKSSLSEVRDWLRVVGGVHLYYRNLRVSPYGDPGHDWLEMNLRRAKSPEERPSTNNSIGRVILEDPYHSLIQKTDRLGFIETESFLDLRRFAMDSLDWAAKVRLHEAEKRRARERVEAPKTVQKAVERLNDVIDEIPKKYQAALSGSIKKLENAVKRESKSLRDDLQLYRSLATAGTTSAVFAHEAAKPVSRIEQLIQLIRTRASKLLGKRYVMLEKHVDLLQRSTTTLKSFTAVPLYLLKRHKRRPGQVNVHEVLNDLIEIFTPFLDAARISIRLEKADSEVQVLGTIALLEAIITNFLTNSVQAFAREGAAGLDRTIILRTQVSGTFLLLQVLDNGPGIRGIRIEDIWLPGRTTIPGGTGFGLTIVKDAVTDLDGEVKAIAHGELGGAEFIVQLPLIGASR